MEEAIVRLFGWVGSGHRNPHWCFGPTVIGMNLRLNAKFDPASTSWISSSRDTVDGLEIRQTHQSRLVVYPTIYRVSYIPDGDRRISSVNSIVIRSISPNSVGTQSTNRT